MAEKRGEVMFVMSQLDFENYLSEPCYSGAVSQMKRPADLRGQKLDKGDFDVLIVHRNYSLCAGEIKSVGFNAADRKLSEQQIQDEVLKVLRKMLKLQKTVTISPHRSMNTSKGVVRDESLAELDDAELIKELKSQGVTSVQRFTGTRNGQQVRLPTIILTFGLPKAPERIWAGFYYVKVSTFIPLPLRCFQCQRLDLTIHKKNQTPDTIYLHGLQQILADFPGFRRIFTDGSKSEDGRVGAAAVMDGRVFTRRLANGTGKTLTAVIMGVEWMRRNKTVNILSGDRKSRAAAHHIKQQLEETARLVFGPQAASRVRLHLVNLEKKCDDQDGAKLADNVDKLVKTLTSSATNNEICLIADEASGYRPNN
nr:hypothetical protein BaRGS_027791 [Batillaria attramentaria]